ncbi:Putative ATPase [Paraburkholderia caribensis MBA4]|uniref:histidine kinase n=1 Tax=Paraburkholderia caribensis MBA4 TaxID=1323664 RepID=A0A0P0RI90_9BURK|nr:ATP-binding sensor histidine kinase [Paraburkholderia caribensis]ALL68282.1 Putative ATPase [Paraburkholderia caribensis MBA4]
MSELQPRGVLLRDGAIELKRRFLPDGKTVLQVTASADDAFGMSRTLQREYALRERLKEHWAAVPIAIRHKGAQTQLSLSDPGGIPLRDLSGHRLPIEQLLGVSLSIATAVAAAHAAGLIHRDISADNVLVDLESNKASLIGFGNAIDSQEALDADAEQELLITTYAYLAPELTGRINRPTDSRCDIYSIGCVLYQLVAGVLPFVDGDLLGSLHSHLTSVPPTLYQVRPDVPEVFSALVAKLIAKDANDRYLSTESLVSDLERCKSELHRTGQISLFPLDHGNISRRLNLVSQPYGMHEAANEIERIFELVVERGGTEAILIYGPSGCGKSTLVQHLHASFVEREHQFTAGKCGEIESATPYGAIASAMNGLLSSSLRLPELEFNAVSSRLKIALGANATLLAPLLPNLRFFVDILEPESLEPAKIEKGHFFETIRRFLTCFTGDRKPLVFFIDDLQWADSGTIAVLRFLASNTDINHLLLVGAARNPNLPTSEGSSDDISIHQDSAIFTSKIALPPLSAEVVGEMVVDVFQCSSDYGRVLADLVHAKTGGNPFFVIRFLGILLNEGLIFFDDVQSGWRWNADRIGKKGYTSNVANLLSTRIASLDERCRFAMETLACLGDHSSIDILSSATGFDAQELREVLNVAHEAQLLQRDGSGYAFWHDRIREAIYETLKNRGRHAELHAEIGRRLSIQLTILPSRNLLFATANQVNLGFASITSIEEKRKFASINLDAGIHAKRAADYQSALNYLECASELTEDTGDGITRSLVEFHSAECEFMTGQLVSAEKRVHSLTAASSNGALDADIARLRTAIYTTTGQVNMAIEVGSQFLRMHGIDFSACPSERDLKRIKNRLSDLARAQDSMTQSVISRRANATWTGVMDVLSDLIPPALFSNNPTLSDYLALAISAITLEHGCCGSSCYGLVCGASTLVYRFHDSAQGMRLGEWALELSKTNGLNRLAARVLMCMGTVVLPWIRPVRVGQSLIREATVRSYEDCDLTFAVYCRRNMASNMLFAGAPLVETMEVVEGALEFSNRARFKMVSDTILVQLMLVSTLKGCYEHSFTSRGLDESWADGLIFGASNTSTGAYAYWVHRLQLAVLFRRWEDALKFERNAEHLLHASAGHVEAADLPLYGALARTVAYLAEGDPTRRNGHRLKIQQYCSQLKKFSANCPENFAGRFALVSAELARLEGRILDAQKFYEKAIDHSCEQGFVQIQALACEAAARFYAEINLETISESLLRNAGYAYLNLGAAAKVQDVEQNLPHKIQERSSAVLGGRLQTQIDTEAVIVASHALSSEILLPRLLEVLLENVVKHAGAVHCVVALKSGGMLRIEAEAHTTSTGVNVTLETRPLDSADIPAGMLFAVNRTRQRILLDDATAMGDYRDDPVVMRRRLRSVLCLPFLKQGSLIGILYVENAQVSGTFTPEKAGLLEVLASQAAISLENARLYAEAIENNARRELAEAALRNSREELARVSRLTTMGQMAASIVHEVSQPLVSISTSAGAALRWMNRAQPNLAEVTDALERIQFDSTRAGDIVQSLRSLARRSDLNFNEFDLNEAAREVLLLTRGQIEKHAVCLDIDGLQGSRFVSGDRVQLQQVILNLVVNAIEAMGENNTRERRLTLLTHQTSRDVTLVVEDTGHGIATDLNDSIFAPFVTTKKDGMGMGLSICASVIESHKGRLTAANRAPYGTRFEAIFPLSGIDCS